MKKLYTLLVSLILISMTAGAQVVTERCFHLDKVQFLDQRQDFWRSHALYSTAGRSVSVMSGGYYNLTEGQYGFGLANTSIDFSRYFAGVTMINGYRLGGGLALGVGVGYQKYNGGYAVPLFADIRYFMGDQRIKFFFAIPGGFLMNFENFKDFSRVFGNPSAGLIVPLAKDLHLSFSVGLYTQYNRSIFTHTDPRYRDSFINMKLGLLFGK